MKYAYIFALFIHDTIIIFIYNVFFGMNRHKNRRNGLWCWRSKWCKNVRSRLLLRKRYVHWSVNTLKPRQNGHFFADNIFKCIFFTKNIWILIKISLKFVSKGPIDNIPAFVQIMAWCRRGDKPLCEPIMSWVADAYMLDLASVG